MPLQSSIIHVGLAKETTQGTAVSPTFWMPVENNIKNEDVTTWIENKSLMGAPVSPIAQYAGPQHTEVDWDSFFYPDVMGNALVALLGLDTISGTTAPYTHLITLTTAQPPSYTQSIYNGFNERQYPGCMMDELQLKYSIDGALTASTKWIGWPSATGTVSTPTMPTSNPFLGWEATLQIAGAADTNLIGFDLTAKRSTKPYNASTGTQAPKFVFAGPLDVTGKLTFQIEDDTELELLLNNTQPAVVLTLTAPNSGPVLAIQMSQCAFKKETPSYSKEVVEVDYDIQAVPNSTDAGTSGPISPIQFSLQNSSQSAY